MKPDSSSKPSNCRRILLLLFFSALAIVALLLLQSDSSSFSIYHQHQHHYPPSSLHDEEDGPRSRHGDHSAQDHNAEQRKEGRHEGGPGDHRDEHHDEDEKDLLPDFHLNPSQGHNNNNDNNRPLTPFGMLKRYFFVEGESSGGDAASGAAAATHSLEKKYPLPLQVHYIRQIHHGIYECRAKLANRGKEHHHHHHHDGGEQERQQQDSHSHKNGETVEVTFAFKTECRPAAKWHGQQGYTEIVVNRVVELIFGKAAIGPFIPGAVGGAVLLPKKFYDVIHRDRCGYLTQEQVQRMYPPSALGREHYAGSDPPFQVMVGVVLEWKPRHDENALPKSSILNAFRVSGWQKKWLTVSRPPSLPRLVRNSTRTATLQISDIFCLDYIVGNEDRLDKNWFKDAGGRFIAMDNGWALAGLNYAGSVCDVDSDNLKCPPLIRGLAKRACKSGEVANCRFRRATVSSIRHRLSVSSSTFDDDDGPNSEADPRVDFSYFARHDFLISFLSDFYPGVLFRGKKGRGRTRVWSIPLARFVDGCSLADMGVEKNLLKRHSGGADDTNNNNNNNIVDKDDALDDSRKHHRLASALRSQYPEPVDMITFGIKTRMKRLIHHVNECVEKFGESSVLL